MEEGPDVALTSRVFAIAFAVYAYFLPQWADWNIDSRLDLVHAIVDQGTLRIDRYHWNTWDKAVYRGHYFSDKAPGVALLAVPVYAAYAAARGAPVTGDLIAAARALPGWRRAVALGKSGGKRATGGGSPGGCRRGGPSQFIPWGNYLVPPLRDWALSAYVVTAAVVGLLSAGFLAFLFWFLGVLGLGARSRLLAVGVYGLGTAALPYSTVLYSHQLAAAFVFSSFALFYLRQSGRTARWAAAAAGLLAGVAIAAEYPAAVLVAPVLGYGVWRLRSDVRDLALAGGAVLLPLLGAAAYNAAAFGNPLDTGYAHDFCWSAQQAAGIAGFTFPRPSALVDLTVSPYRGLLFYSPFLLLAAPGSASMWRRGLRAEAVLCVVASVTYLVAMSAYWGWNGGRADGPRYLVAALPFVVMPSSFAVEGLLRSVAGRTVLVAASAWSMAACFALFLGGERFPDSWLRDPLVQYSFPNLIQSRLTLNLGMVAGLDGWVSLLPLGLLLFVLVVWPSRSSPSEAVAEQSAKQRRIS